MLVSNEQMRKLLVALLVVVNVTFAYISWDSDVCVPGPYLAASQARARPGCRSEAP